MTTDTFPKFINAQGFTFTHDLSCVVRPVPRIATETDSGECHVIGLPLGTPDVDRQVRVLPPRPEGMGDTAWAKRAGGLGVCLYDRTDVRYRVSIDVPLRRDTGLDPFGATFDPDALASAWLAPHAVQKGKPARVGYSARVDRHGAFYAGHGGGLLAPHALPLDAGVLSLRSTDMVLFALAVRFMRQQGLAVVGRVWFTDTGDGQGYWTLRAGVEDDEPGRAPHAAIVARPADAQTAGDIRVRALFANAQRERASFVVTRDAFARLFSGTAFRALIVQDGRVSTHADGAARAVSVRSDEVDGTAAIGVCGDLMRDALDSITGDRVRVTVADDRTPLVVSDADAHVPPVFAMVLPAVDCTTYVAPVPPRAA